MNLLVKATLAIAAVLASTGVYCDPIPGAGSEASIRDGKSVRNELSDLTVGNYVLLEQERLDRYSVELTYSAQLTNTGEDARNVVADLTLASPFLSQAGPSRLTFGDSPAGSIRQSQQVFRVIHDRSGSFDEADLLWSVSFVPSPVALDAPPQITADTTITLRGTAPRSETVQIVTPTASSTSDVSDGRFEAEVALTTNMRNQLSVTAIAADGERSATTMATVVQDSSPPMVHVDTPLDGGEIINLTTDVVGRVSDLLSGFMGLAVSVNGISAEVDAGIGTNGTFLARNVPLTPGADTILLVEAVDAVGNRAIANVTVLQVPVPVDSPWLEVALGNHQETQVNTMLPDPLAVRLTRADGTPFANKVVTFEVMRSDGRLSADGFGAGQMLFQQRTDASGEARAYLRVGSDAGSGNNRVIATSRDVAGSATFFSSAFSGPPTQINIGAGENQRGEVSSPLSSPLRVWVSDGRNGVSGVAVTFGVVTGGGNVDALDEVTVPTSATGHAEVAFTLGPNQGNHRVRATFPGFTGVPATFTAFGLERQEDMETRLAGLVLDNGNRPIEGASVTATVAGQALAATQTDRQGQFEFLDIPDGAAKVHVDGLVATAVDGEPVLPGSFPALGLDTVVVPNADNTLPAPVLLPRLDPTNATNFDNTTDTILGVDGIDGLQMLVRAGSMTLADGSSPSPAAPAILSLNQVHFDNVPMPMPDGAAPPFAWTLQPAGARFDPPIEVTYPNMSGLAPGSVAYFLSFDHQTNRFEIVASGSVSTDGSSISSDPGTGLSVSGWGCNCPPYSVSADCCVENITCTDNGSLSGGSVSVDDPMPMLGDTFTCSVSGVTDSGGTKEVECPGGQQGGSTEPVAPATVTYAYDLMEPFSSRSGDGDSLTVDANEFGDYVCRFTAEVERDCPPSPLVVGEQTVCVGSQPPSGEVTAVTYAEDMRISPGSNWGIMRPDPFTDVDIEAYFDCATKKWKPKVVLADSTYDIGAQLLPGVREASVGVATEANHCQMIADLNALGGSSWYVLAAVEAHEQVHVQEWEDSLNPEFATMKSTIEALTVEHTAGKTATQARTEIIGLSQYGTAITTANTDARTVFFAIPDPNANTDAAERAVVDPIVVQIQMLAATQGWAACPP